MYIRYIGIWIYSVRRCMIYHMYEIYVKWCMLELYDCGESTLKIETLIMLYTMSLLQSMYPTVGKISEK